MIPFFDYIHKLFGLQTKNFVIIAALALFTNPKIKLRPPIGLIVLARHIFSVIKNEPNNLEFWY